MYAKEKKPFACKLLIFLQFFLGVGAVFGGGALILSPSGSLLHMPNELLQHSPFHSFLIPGMILFLVLGVIPIITAIFLITKKSLIAFEKLSVYPFRQEDSI